jgi:hypothetical protein
VNKTSAITIRGQHVDSMLRHSIQAV